MSLRPDDNRSRSPAPWSASKPWSSPSNAPGAYPHSPSSDPGMPPLSAHQSLSVAVKARKDEYVRKKTIKIKVGTWNTAAMSGCDADLGGWFVKGLGVKGLSQDLAGLALETSQDLTKDEHVETAQDQEARFKRKKTTLPQNDVAAVPSGDEIGLYVLGLQEVIDVASVTEAMKPFTDPNPAKKWKTALRKALPAGYEKIAEQQLLGLLILVFAAPDLAPTISSVSCSSVGTGLLGYMGNKGAVSVRLVLAETTRLCFVNCHLAAGADANSLTRRIWDQNQIIMRTHFSPVSLDGEVVEGSEEKIGDEDFAFWFGDLNFRLDDIPGEDVRRLLLLHTRNEYDVSNKSRRRIDSELGYIAPDPSDSRPVNHYEISDVELPASESTAEPTLDPKNDPASLHTTLHSLLSHDQLKAQQRSRKVFYEGWREGDINFLPTYKYDVGSVGMFDSGEKKRSPSWCDRILFRTRRDRLDYETQARHEADARKKDEEMVKKGLDQAAEEQDVLFNYDPETDGMAYGDDYDEDEDSFQDAELVKTQEGYEDEINLDHYISHQRVLSSDHKPLDAIFTLTYDAAIPELKAKVQQEVARELDKAENEGRPNVTLVFDNHANESGSEADEPVEPSASPSSSPDMSFINFGKVRYQIPKRRTMTVANTGPNEASLQFVGRGENDETSDIAPSWLRLHTSKEDEDANLSKGPTKQCKLLPGETMTIDLDIDIREGDLVYDLNEGKLQLEDVLVLRIVNGRDYFIPVKGSWMSTCFYRTLDELVTAPEGGVRNLPMSPKNRDLTGTNNIASVQSQHSAPKELFVLAEAIPNYVERALADWEMLHPNEPPSWVENTGGVAWPFDESTWNFESGEERSRLLAAVREALDTAQPLGSKFDGGIPALAQLEILAESLASFLRSLRDGVITMSMWSTIEQQLVKMEKDKNQGTNSENIQANVMEVLSHAPVHSVSMTFLTFMLSRIINELTSISAEPQIKSPLSRRSRASSTLSSEAEAESESEHASIASTPTPSIQSATKRSFFPTIRRRRENSSAETEPVTPQDRRKILTKRYSDFIAPLIIRSEQDSTAKGKDLKLLESRKKKVLQAFLDTS